MADASKPVAPRLQNLGVHKFPVTTGVPRGRSRKPLGSIPATRWRTGATLAAKRKDWDRALLHLERKSALEPLRSIRLQFDLSSSRRSESDRP